MLADERLAILTMLEARQITAEQAADLLDAVEPRLLETTLPEATAAEEAWMLTPLLPMSCLVAKRA